MRQRGPAWLVALTLLALVLPPGAWGQDFESCKELLRAQPDDYESAYCFYEAARQSRSYEGTAGRVQSLAAELPENHWLTLVLGHLRWRFDPSNTEATYRDAAKGFARQGHLRGEVLTRVNLYAFLARRGELERAGEEVEKVATVVASSDDPILTARSFVLQAEHLRNRGHDLEAAYRLLRQAERWIFPDGPPRLKRQCLSLLGSVSHRLGRYSQAMRYYGRLEDLVRDEGDEYAAALSAYNQANTLLAGEFALPTLGGREELIERFRQAIHLAQEAGHRSAELQAHRSLGDLLSPFEETRYEAAEHHERCTELAGAMSRSRRLALCLASQAGHMARWGESKRSTELLQQSLALAMEAEDAELILRVYEERMQASWRRGARAEALAEAEQAIDIFEDLRQGQQASSARANLLAAWSDLYYWPSGQLLQGQDSAPTRDDLERAFRILERLRARVLLESTESSKAADFVLDEDAWSPVLADLVQVQRRLLVPELAEAERRRALRELERAEMNEAEVWRHVRGAPQDSIHSFASLDDVEATLAPNEALLSFQVGLWEDVYGDFAGGSWLMVSTRGGTEVHRVPDRVALQPAVRLLNGLIESREPAAATAAAGLYGRLLKEALHALPPGIERLLLVPDGDLHLLPFSALRESPEAPTLAERFHLSRLPSVTLWLRWREAKSVPRTAPGQVLVFADPLPAAQVASTAASERDWALASGAVLGALPEARVEGRRILDRLGEGGLLLLGAEAAESFLKGPQLHDFDVLHFAAHAVIDTGHPQRSAVLLAPGAPEEDGLLQPRDIARLDLEGKVVVLSACQGSSGTVLRGEGVLSLARAFFAAGSSAVVGSLWRLRDDEAAQLFDRFYAHLSEGQSVEAALAAAQADRIQAGAPAGAWAGLSVLGDGSVVPFPGERSGGGQRVGWMVVLFLGALVIARVMRRRGR